ncbi:Uncharacterised protein [Vibrio cholerae]|nr:Uncharacterised protein [Vibrio cholerae]CSI29890.1 Uncharacterised protein [Vibrio cholerae]
MQPISLTIWFAKAVAMISTRSGWFTICCA